MTVHPFTASTMISRMNGAQYCAWMGIAYRQPEPGSTCFQAYRDEWGEERYYYARYAVCPACGHRNKMGDTTWEAAENIVLHTPVTCRNKRCKKHFTAQPDWNDYMMRRVHYSIRKAIYDHSH